LGYEHGPTRLLLVSADPAVARDALEAAARLGVCIDVMEDVDQALAWMLRPERLCSHLLAPASLDPQRIDSLAGMVDEVTLRPTPLMLLGAEDDQGPSVLAVEGGTYDAIAHTLRDYRPFVPPELPELREDELRVALHGGMLRMRFQPILDAATLRPTALEALARLHHPTLGILRPKDFMPQAEASGQERALTGIAAARAMLELRVLPGLAGLDFALNVPLTTFCNSFAVDRAIELMAVVALAPQHVIIEVLETQQRPDLELLAAAVERWRAGGFQVTIDDAGPALPHWRELLDLPFTGVKLDGVLAADTPETRLLAGEIVSAAKRAGLSVIAEGIEDQAALQRMRALGVDAVQGFLFCRPLPARAVPVWLDEWRSGELPRPV
jgi:EAL domain-containing protein (putative c-di-GMP-specific phosphodiesterase class I)